MDVILIVKKSQESGIVAGSASTTQWGNGLIAGLGLETAIDDRFSVRGEYNYISYGSYDSSLGTVFSPSNSQFMLGLLYHFC
jgi:opacity protein-like surface antigen